MSTLTLGLNSTNWCMTLLKPFQFWCLHKVVWWFWSLKSPPSYLILQWNPLRYTQMHTKKNFLNWEKLIILFTLNQVWPNYLNIFLVKSASLAPLGRPYDGHLHWRSCHHCIHSREKGKRYFQSPSKKQRADVTNLLTPNLKLI